MYESVCMCVHMCIHIYMYYRLKNWDMYILYADHPCPLKLPCEDWGQESKGREQAWGSERSAACRPVPGLCHRSSSDTPREFGLAVQGRSQPGWSKPEAKGFISIGATSVTWCVGTIWFVLFSPPTYITGWWREIPTSLSISSVSGALSSMF